jgi:hypothetical protein
MKAPKRKRDDIERLDDLADVSLGALKDLAEGLKLSLQAIELLHKHVTQLSIRVDAITRKAA